MTKEENKRRERYSSLKIQGETLWSKDVPLEGSETITLGRVGYYAIPTHPGTLQILTDELTHVAEQIPYSVYPGAAYPPISEDPAIWPRAFESKKVTSADDWDFLKAASGPRIRDAILTSRSQESRKRSPLLPPRLQTG